MNQRVLWWCECLSVATALALVSVVLPPPPASAATEEKSEKTHPGPLFLTRTGAQLLMGGRPFRAVGVNKHELLDLYMPDLLGKGDAAASMAAARRSLDRLASLGVTVLRVRGSQFWPAQIEKTYLGGKQTRKIFWDRYDTMLDDCDARGLKVVLTIGWHLGAWPDLGHDSLQNFVGDPHSKGRALFDGWVRDLVGRYKDRDTILFWELTNEANLGADLRPMKPKGVITPILADPSTPHGHLYRDPVVRDVRNNMSSDELAAFVRESARLIKSIDRNHLIGTGFSLPRPAAWHLWLGSLRRTTKMDWTPDSDGEWADYLRLISPDPVDLISIHHYLGTGRKRIRLERLVIIKKAADELRKPVYWGEAGVSGFPGQVYDRAAARIGLRCVLDAVRILDIPLCLLWTWNEAGRPVHEPVLRPGSQPEVLELLREAQARARAMDAPQKESVSTVDIARLRALDQEFLDAAGAVP
ncbi:MAG: cellulase family glycosylhydrolase [Kiritimatiellaeota bacterium]|nr:cellulase family glycosylhydrolase [Kiritimatiellota bacterium]